MRKILFLIQALKTTLASQGTSYSAADGLGNGFIVESMYRYGAS